MMNSLSNKVEKHIQKIEKNITYMGQSNTLINLPNKAFQAGYYRLKHECRSYLALYPKLFFPFVYLKKTSRELAVGDQTDIVIEGFPRSGNSFAVSAFRAAQFQPVSIAHHLHAPAQIILGSRKKIPTLVVIRKPADAVISLKALNIECHALSLAPCYSLSLKQLLKHYILFYLNIFAYRNHYVLGVFDEVTNDFGAIIAKINQRFYTNFSIFEHSEPNVKRIFAQGGLHTGPTNKRNEIKVLLQKELDSKAMKPLVKKAEAIYQQYVQLSQL